MDGSELHYVDYDVESTWIEMHKTYIQNGGDILYPGDEKEYLLRTVLAIGTAIMAKVDNACRMMTRRYATGEYLKVYGDNHNCPYIEAVAAEAPVTITFQATGTAQTIEAGTELTADGMVIYATIEDIEQTGEAQTVETTVRCQTPGTIGNGLHQGAQLQFINGNEAVLSAIVTANASGGTDAEEEEAYRERIGATGLASVTTGPYKQYESAAMAVSTQILDARVPRNLEAGDVTICLILASGADEEAIFADVQAALSPYDTRPMSDLVTVVSATEVPYTLNVKAYVGIFTALTADPQDTVDQYLAWQDNKVNRAWNPDKLRSMLYQIGCDRVEFLEGSGMDGSMDYTEIGEDERCKGTITLTVVST